MASTVNDTSYSSAVKINSTILLVIIPVGVIFTLMGNGAYIITLIKKRALHLPSNILLGSLAISDILIAVVAEPLWIAKISFTLNDHYSDTFENVKNGITFIFLLISLLNIVAVSIDRYMAVFHPFWYHAKATCKTHLTVAFGVLATSIMIYVLLILVHMISKTYIPYAYVSLICISLSITGYCNMKIFSFIRNHTRQVQAVSNGASDEENGNVVARGAQEKNKSAIIAIITALFFALYMPFAIHSLVKIHVVDRDRNGETLGTFWVFFCVLLNSCVNPIVYYARMKRFRKAAKEVFCNRNT